MTSLLDPGGLPHRAQGSDHTRGSRSDRADALVRELSACTTPEREVELRDELICLHLCVATTIATRYHARGLPDEDLDQVALLALTKAARRFDPTAGHPFLAFAVPTIRGEIRRYFRDHGWMVRPPRRIQDLQYRLWSAESQLTADLERLPTPHELAQHLEAPLDDVLESLDARHCFTPASLDRPISDHSNTTLGDLQADEDTSHTSVEARTVLGPAVRDLTPRDRHILQLRFYDGLTQVQIAERLGVTQVQVSRLLTRIYRDLRRHVGPLDSTPPPQN